MNIVSPTAVNILQSTTMEQKLEDLISKPIDRDTVSILNHYLKDVEYRIAARGFSKELAILGLTIRHYLLQVGRKDISFLVKVEFDINDHFGDEDVKN